LVPGGVNFSEGTRDVLARLKLQNLDDGILGEEFPEGVFTVIQDADHFDLMAADRVLAEVDGLVAEVERVRAAGRGTHNQPGARSST
jgi:hypothetical protein